MSSHVHITKTNMSIFQSQLLKGCDLHVNTVNHYRIDFINLYLKYVCMKCICRFFIEVRKLFCSIIMRDINKIV